MTVHASVELVDAMRGECPASGAKEAAAAGDPDLCDACTKERSGNGVPASIGWPRSGKAAEPRREVVDCPACLALIRAATDPVRWDALESRGLVKL